MTKDHIDLVIERLYEWLANLKLPTGRFNKNKQTISISYDFKGGAIPKVKIIAPRKWWLDLNWSALEEDQITLEAIKPYLSRPSRKTQELLKEYAHRDPDLFTYDVRECLGHASRYFPVTMERGGSPYGRSWAQM
ncbi:MAG: hypothetical protein JRI54_14850, partial [Deltaproteobacteria bacterium]|nr:hypothetical protein [Deltaproteobacteria bacterium]